jgi:hypothetical protein
MRERDALASQTHAWLQDWQDIADLMLPGQSDILSWRQPGTTRTRQLYDSTAMWALDTFVAHLGAWITNWQMLWFGLRMRSLRDNQEAARWLDDVSQILYEEMVSDEAPVTTAVHEAYRQYAGFGTGALYLDEQQMAERLTPGFRGYEAHSLLIGTYYTAESATGRVDTLYEDRELSPHQAAEIWGKEALHTNVQDALSDDGAARRFEPGKYLHAVYPRRDRDRGQRDAKNMPWASCWVDVTHKHLVHESGYRWFPYLVFRWEKISQHTPWGFGRGHIVLPESKTLQLIDKDALRALPMTILPPGWLVGESRETIGRVSLLPGTLNPLAKGGSFVPYASGSRMDLAQLQIEERRSRILRAFYIDQLQFLPETTQRTHRTLGELMLRRRQMARIMGPAFFRLLAEFLNPFIDVSFSLMLHAGAFPQPPDVIIEAALANQGHINVEYLGPLARAQKEDDVEAITEGVEFVLQLAERTGDRAILQNVALDDTVARFLRARGFPEPLITDRRFMEAVRAQAQVQAEQQAQLDTGSQVAKAAGDAAPALDAIREFTGAQA